MDQEPKDLFPVGMGESPKTDLERGFTYYFQDMNGSSNIWKEMIDKLKLSSSVITGLISRDGSTIVWSDNVPSHEMLKLKFKEQQGIYADVQMYAQTYPDKVLRVGLISENIELANKWYAYLERSGVDPLLIKPTNI